jgi:hypothetical protein
MAYQSEYMVGQEDKKKELEGLQANTALNTIWT